MEWTRKLRCVQPLTALLLGTLVALAAPKVQAAQTTIRATFHEVHTVRNWTLFKGTDRSVYLEFPVKASADMTLYLPGSGQPDPFPDATRFLIEVRDTSAHYDDIREALKACSQMGLIAQARPERYELYILLETPEESITFTESNLQVRVLMDEGFVDCRTIKKNWN